MNPNYLKNFMPRSLSNVARALVLITLTSILTVVIPQQARATTTSKTSSSSKSSSSKSSTTSKQVVSKSQTSSKSQDKDDDNKGKSSGSDTKSGDKNQGGKYDDDDHHSSSGSHDDRDDDDDDSSSCGGGGSGGSGGGGGVVLVPVTILNTTGSQLIITLGNSGTLTARLVAGSTPVTYQWMKRDSLGAFSAIPGATSLSLTLSNTTQAATGEYWVVATNSLGPVPSASTQVVIASSLTVLNTTGSDLTVLDGGTINLTAQLISGTQPVTYQWWRNFNNVPAPVLGANALNLTILNASGANNGQYWIVATNASGSVPSTSTQVVVGFSE